MKLLFIQDEREDLKLTSTEAYSISVKKYDNLKLWPNLQRLVEDVATQQFDGIILSATLGDPQNYLGLEFCIRLRLSNSDIKSKAFVSLFVYSSIPVEELYKEQIQLRAQPTAAILLTRGVFIFNNQISFDILCSNKNNYNLIDSENFEQLVLDAIRINQPPKFGAHSLANIMGAIGFATLTGNGSLLDSNPNVINNKDDLFIKYKTISNKWEHVSFPKMIIPSKGRRVLFVDDKEDHGWSDALKEIFEPGILDFVSAGKDFVNRAEKKALESDWDLILLDLRLEDSEDYGDIAIKSAAAFSGAKLLEKIKSLNRGTQVIIFTASNKAWNLWELINPPFYADGYFIKESPELLYEASLSLKNINNFESQIKDCFKREFLKIIFSKIKTIKKELKKSLWTNSLAKEDQFAITQFETLAYSKMDTAFELMDKVKAGIKDNKIRLAFLQFYQILEDYSSLNIIYQIPVDKRKNSKVLLKTSTNVDVYGPDSKITGNVKCNIKFSAGRFPYQSEDSSDTIIAVTYGPNTFKPGANVKLQTSETTLFKILNIFKERHAYSEQKCDEIIELTYLRSNLCGHETRNIDTSKRDITSADLIRIVSIIESII